MKKYLVCFFKGIGAGSAISLGSILFVLSSAFINQGKILGSILFPIGLILVCFLGLNLYTGKIGYLFVDKNIKQRAIDLPVMLLGNILSSFLIGYIFFLITKNINQISSTMQTIYTNKTDKTVFMSLVSSFLCGLFVYGAVFFYKYFKNKVLKAIAIIILIALFVYMSYDHCIANSFYFAAANQLMNPTSYISLLISIIGNSLSAIAINFFIQK